MFQTKIQTHLISSRVPPVIIDARPEKDPVHVFLQFFLPVDQFRLQEVQFCLKKHVENPEITAIYLLGERIYSNDELGIVSAKIKQINLGHRLTYSDVFSYIEDHVPELPGYHVLLNADIFLDTNAIGSIQQSPLHLERSAYALLRHEYNHTNPSKSHLFGPRFDSQDTWIFHSNFPVFGPNMHDVTKCAFDINLGRPGCDNRIAWLLEHAGYELFNDPMMVKTYHVHRSQKRSYHNTEPIKGQWAGIIPCRVNPYKIRASLGIYSFVDETGKLVHFFEPNLMYPKTAGLHFL